MNKKFYIIMFGSAAALAFGAFYFFEPASPPDLAAAAVQKSLKEKGLWANDKPLKLHLGCGEVHLDGYANLDFPPARHSVMNTKADVFADIPQLAFPPGSVDEVRLHHVFEHFTRVHALALLAHWHEWLKIGGILHIETPDVEGCAETLLMPLPLKTKMRIVRHLAGDQADTWGFHVDHWFAERFEHTLTAMGFEIVSLQKYRWPKEPYLSNVTVIARKTQNLSRSRLQTIGNILLRESAVSPKHEKPMYEKWKEQFHAALNGVFDQSPGNRTVPYVASEQEDLADLEDFQSPLVLEAEQECKGSIN